MAQVELRELLALVKQMSARYAQRLGTDEAADLIGEALLRGLERPPTDGRLAPWLERIARNLLVDRWRRSRVAARFVADLPERCFTPEELALVSERRERLRAVTRGLAAMVPWRVFHWAAGAANPAAATALLLTLHAPPPATAQKTAAAPASANAIHLALPSTARPTSPPEPPSPRPAVVHARSPVISPVQRFDYDDDQVEGDIQRPDGEPLRAAVIGFPGRRSGRRAGRGPGAK